MVGVFSLKFELTEFLLNYGRHIGYAVCPSKRNCGLATQMLKQGLEFCKGFGFDRITSHDSSVYIHHSGVSSPSVTILRVS